MQQQLHKNALHWVYMPKKAALETQLFPAPLNKAVSNITLEETQRSGDPVVRLSWEIHVSVEIYQ